MGGGEDRCGLGHLSECPRVLGEGEGCTKYFEMTRKERAGRVGDSLEWWWLGRGRHKLCCSRLTVGGGSVRYVSKTSNLKASTAQ